MDAGALPPLYIMTCSPRGAQVGQRFVDSLFCGRCLRGGILLDYFDLQRIYKVLRH